MNICVNIAYVCIVDVELCCYVAVFLRSILNENIGILLRSIFTFTTIYLNLCKYGAACYKCILDGKGPYCLATTRNPWQLSGRHEILCFYDFNCLMSLIKHLIKDI